MVVKKEAAVLGTAFCPGLRSQNLLLYSLLHEGHVADELGASEAPSNEAARLKLSPFTEMTSLPLGLSMSLFVRCANLGLFQEIRWRTTPWGLTTEGLGRLQVVNPGAQRSVQPHHWTCKRGKHPRKGIGALVLVSSFWRPKQKGQEASILFKSKHRPPTQVQPRPESRVALRGTE